MESVTDRVFFKLCFVIIVSKWAILNKELQKYLKLQLTFLFFSYELWYFIKKIDFLLHTKKWTQISIKNYVKEIF